MARWEEGKGGWRAGFSVVWQERRNDSCFQNDRQGLFFLRAQTSDGGNQTITVSTSLPLMQGLCHSENSTHSSVQSAGCSFPPKIQSTTNERLDVTRRLCSDNTVAGGGGVEQCSSRKLGRGQQQAGPHSLGLPRSCAANHAEG